MAEDRYYIRIEKNVPRLILGKYGRTSKLEAVRSAVKVTKTKIAKLQEKLQREEETLRNLESLAASEGIELPE